MKIKQAKCQRHFIMVIQILICIQKVDASIFFCPHNACFYSFHNQLKTIQLNGKVNRTIHFVIYQVLLYAFFNYKRHHQLPPAIDRTMNENLIRYESGISILVQDVQVTLYILYISFFN